MIQLSNAQRNRAYCALRYKQTYSVIHLFKIDNKTNKPTDFQRIMPIVSGLFVPKLRPAIHLGDINLLRNSILDNSNQVDNLRINFANSCSNRIFYCIFASLLR